MTPIIGFSQSEHQSVKTLDKIGVDVHASSCQQLDQIEERLGARGMSPDFGLAFMCDPPFGIHGWRFCVSGQMTEDEIAEIIEGSHMRGPDCDRIFFTLIPGVGG